MTGPDAGRWSGLNIVAVIQARMTSNRIPGKSLIDIEGEPLLVWTIRAVAAIRGVSTIVIATTSEPADEPIEALAADLGVAVHRGPVYDVLTRCYDAVAPYRPDVVVRQTADNPFADPGIAEWQIQVLLEGDLDYVGIAGWPIGIAAEACRFTAFATAHREATDLADREHVMPFLYRQPERFRIGPAPRLGKRRPAAARARYSVDTVEDLAFAREMAARLPVPPPVDLETLEAIIEAAPELVDINADVIQKSFREAELTEEARWTS